MEEEIITSYFICDELLKSMNIREDIRVKTNNAEVMTVVPTAAWFFGGHIRNSSIFLKEHGYIPDMLGESRPNRRIHEIDDFVWETLFHIISEIHKKTNESREYVIDSFPIPVCDNIRIGRSNIFEGEDYRGHIPSKRRYFYGIRVHMIVTASGEPVEFVIAPGADSDTKVFEQIDFDLPENSICYGDKSYDGYQYEDLLLEASGIIFGPLRKKNSLRATDSYVERLAAQHTGRRVETSFSEITRFFQKRSMP